MSRVPKSLRRFSIDPLELITSSRLYTPEHVGAYVRLLCFMWSDGSKHPHLPFSDETGLARLAGVSVRRWRKMAPVVMAMFDVRDRFVYSSMLTKQWSARMEGLARPEIDLPRNARPGSRGKAKGRSRAQVKGPRRTALLARDGDRCVWCGATESLCLDHVIPVSLGGDDSDDNYQVLCQSCNSRKGSAEVRLA